MFRNRWIGDEDHAALLKALIQATRQEGAIGFVRGSGLSLSELLTTQLWPVLVDLWLWKNLTRFRPLETTEMAPALRGYEHHLEALGDFQWRLDRGHALLAALRARIHERGPAVRRTSCSSSPNAPPCPRTTANLQRLHQVLQ